MRSSAIIVLILCQGLAALVLRGETRSRQDKRQDHFKFQFHIDLTLQHNQTFLVIKLIRQSGKLKRKSRIIRIVT